MQDQLLVEQGRAFARAFRNAWYAEMGQDPRYAIVDYNDRDALVRRASDQITGGRRMETDLFLIRRNMNVPVGYDRRVFLEHFKMLASPVSSAIGFSIERSNRGTKKRGSCIVASPMNTSLLVTPTSRLAPGRMFLSLTPRNCGGTSFLMRTAYSMATALRITAMWTSISRLSYTRVSAHLDRDGYLPNGYATSASGRLTAPETGIQKFPKP